VGKENAKSWIGGASCGKKTIDNPEMKRIKMALTEV
jgi:hypothetical protein